MLGQFLRRPNIFPLVNFSLLLSLSRAGRAPLSAARRAFD